MKKYLYIIMCCIGMLGFMSCSESSEDNTEFINWKAQNDEYFEAAYQEAVAKSAADPEHWKVVKACTKDKNTPGAHTDYVIIQVLESKGNKTTPEFTDSVRVHYRGYLKDSKSYNYVTHGRKTGLCFDSSYYGDELDNRTAVPRSFALSDASIIVGFSTALQSMHPGDRCLVTIPYQLAYLNKDNSSIPAYSTLVFDLTLVSYLNPGGKFPVQ